jgi:hypothetical protein
MRCLYDDDLEGFTQNVAGVQIEQISLLQNVKGTNILHDFANCSRSTLPFFMKCVNFLPTELIRQMLDSKSSEKDNLTPLQLSVVFNKRVVLNSGGLLRF